MNAISIQFPNVQGKHDIEVDVKIDGVRQQFSYRVDVFYWDDWEEEENHNKENRVDCIKKIVSDYDDNWEVAQIGMPTETYIPITFMRKGEEL